MLEAVLFDLGDVIMAEETEEKVDGVTMRAELHPGMDTLIRNLHRRGVPLGLVADTRDGTYRNVLGMHGILDLFRVFASRSTWASRSRTAGCSSMRWRVSASLRSAGATS